MAEFKLVIGTKDGKCVQKEVKDADAKVFLGKKIGDKVSGDECGFAGYEFEVTGGSDFCGFPMRSDVGGTGRKRILAISGVGLKKKRRGQRQRKTVCGNTVHAKISQVNLKILKKGSAEITAEAKEAEAKEGEAPKEEAKPEKAEAKPAEEKKEEKTEKEEKPAKEEKKAEAPKEDKKEEKPEEKSKAEEKPEPSKPGLKPKGEAKPEASKPEAPKE